MEKIRNALNSIAKLLFMGILFITISVVLVSTIRGIPGNPTPGYIYENLRSKATAFEVSPERGRYALLYSIIENGSYEFTQELAEMAVPDLAIVNGKYVSLFAPGVSFIAIPFYILGKSVQLAQVGAFSTSAFFAFLNILVITAICYKLTKNFFAGLLAGITFLFGTVAWSYAVTLYQHHITTFFLLTVLWLLIGKRNVIKNILIGVVIGLSIFVEYPNAIFFVPLLGLLLFRHVDIKPHEKNLKVTFFYSILFAGVGFVIGMIPFFYYNQVAYNNPLQLSGTLQGVRTLEATESASIQTQKASYNKKTALGFFRYERIPQGLDVILTSKDRGLLFYSPIVFLGFAGVLTLWKRKKDITLTIVGVIIIFLGLYSMWGDPWGGWAFGPRYLIPLTAFLAILLSESIHFHGKKLWFGIMFFILLTYSVIVNLIGVLTTHQIPPSVEQDAKLLPNLQYLHNFDLFYQGITDSFVYNTYLRNVMTLQTFGIILNSTIVLLAIILYVLAVRRSYKEAL